MFPRLISLLVAVNLVGSSIAVPTQQAASQAQITLPKADSKMAPVDHSPSLPLSSSSSMPGTTIRRIHRVDFTYAADRDLYWSCAGESEVLWCRLRKATTKMTIDSTQGSVAVCQGIAVLIFSTSLVISLICMLWSRLYPKRQAIILTDDSPAQEKLLLTADTQRIASADTAV